MARSRVRQVPSQAPHHEIALHAVEAELAFTRKTDVRPDHERPGLLRARTHSFAADPRKALDFRQCTIRDLAAPGEPNPDLERMGFDTIDLSSLSRLQSVLESVRASGHLTNEQAKTIRRELRGRSFRLSNGKTLRLLYIADEGFILRKSGPNGLKADINEKMTEMNGHDAAVSVHGDQDVFGTPLKQILRGAAPRLFRHDTPDGRNTRSPMMLVNVWIPLQQVTRPLAFMDRRTLDKHHHQLRYALPVESFLSRDEKTNLNDIWTFLHDDTQQWYFTSDIDASRAYVFDTLGEPHGAFILPGEDVAEQVWLRLRDALDAALNGDIARLQAACQAPLPAMPDDTTVPLKHAVRHMALMLEAAGSEVARGRLPPSHWSAAARESLDRLIRKSIEMRVVGVLTPRWFGSRRSMDAEKGNA